MENVWFGAIGCFIGTILAIFIFPFWYITNPFFVLLLPMWGMIMGTSIGATVKKKK